MTRDAAIGSRSFSRLAGITLAVLALTTSVLVVACGSDEEAEPSPYTATATSAAPTTQPQSTATAEAEPDPTETPSPETVADANESGRNGTPLTLDMDIRGVDEWINSEPTTIGELINDGKVVLVDFWTYTCVNCLRTLPFLRDWQEKYADRGLVILGVHAPEFEFEKEIENVQMAVNDEGINWPVALDNEMSTWRAFNNRYWPAKYLIGTDGEVHYSHFGEGKYKETELEIRRALEIAGYDVSDIPVGEIENEQRDSDAMYVTRELYGGYERNYSVYGQYAAQTEYYLDPDQEVDYSDAYALRGNYPRQQFVLSGLWRNERESIVHARETDDLSDYIALQFQGRSANVVIDPPEPETFNVYVELDGRPLTEDELGDDMQIDDEGRSFFTVDEGRMYKIVEVPEYVSRVLKLSSDSPNFAIFAFTFGIYQGGF